MELFKYRGNFGRDLISLSLNQIYAPTYDRLNDPFEGMMDFSEDYKTLEFLKSLNGNDNLKVAYDAIVEELKYKGVYSLSRDFKNEILWSLYANGHEGFVIGYNVDKLLEDINFNKEITLANILTVGYETKPKGLLRWRDLPYNGLNLSNAIGIKSKNWEYENEVRIIFEQNGITEYNYQAVSRIIFGMRSAESDIVNTMKLLKGRNYRYQRIVKQESSFELDLEELPDVCDNGLTYRQNLAKFDESLISAENIEYGNLKTLADIKDVINSIRGLPNITEITSVNLDSENSPEILNIFCNHSHKNLPVRFFQFQKCINGFKQIN